MKTTWSILAIGALVAATLSLFASCGSDDDKNDDNAATGTVSFATDVKPILDKTCAASGCHAGNSNLVTIDDAAGFKAEPSLKARLQLTSGDSMMPPATLKDDNGKTYTISAADKATLIKYIDQ